MKKSFMLYCDQYKPVRDFTQSQKAELFDAIFCYNCGEDIKINDPIVKAVFGFFITTFERDQAKYLKRCEINRKNGSTGGKRTQANATKRKRTQANQADSDSDSDSDSDKIENNIPHQDAEQFYLTKKKRKLSGKRLESFERFWESFNYKKDKASAADSWLDIPSLTATLVEKICEAAKIEANSRQEKLDKKQTPIYAQGWLTARRWEDEQFIPKQKTIIEFPNLPTE